MPPIVVCPVENAFTEGAIVGVKIIRNGGFGLLSSLRDRSPGCGS